MSFLAIFIALLLERFFDCSHLRKWAWYQSYQQFILQKLPGKSGRLLFAATVVPLVILVMLAAYMVSGMMYGVIKLVFTILVLLYCFGPRNLWADTFATLNAMVEGDGQALRDKLQMAFGVTEESHPEAMHHQWINAIYTAANVRVFALVFWFACTGLLGVVVYRLVAMLSMAAADEADAAVVGVAKQARGYLDWPAIRVLIVMLALGGNYARVNTCWQGRYLQGPGVNEALLLDCGLAALNGANQGGLPIDGSVEREEIGLIDRSIAIMLVLTAVVVFWLP